MPFRYRLAHRGLAERRARSWRLRWWGRATLVALLAGALTGAVPAASSAHVAAASPARVAAAAPALIVGTPAKADDGAYVVAETYIDPRVVDLTIYSPALGGNVMTRLILPRDWSAQPFAKWPTFYLLHGAGEPQDYRSWTSFTDIEAFTADKNVLTVLPSDGLSGFYTDWIFGGSKQPRKWETFHTVELLQILQRGYRSGPNRAVAGLSVGGYGAMAYTFRHPGLFKAAASYSGLVNTTFPGAPVIVQVQVLRAGENPMQMWGDPILNFIGWSSRNPNDNVNKLKGIPLYVSCGNGQAAFGDAPLDASLLEDVTAPGNQDFVAKLRQAGANVTADLGNPGLHSWPYWQIQLHKSWPVLAQGLGLPA